MSIIVQTVTANEAKARFGVVLEQAQREPVTITRHGRPSAVVLSAQDYAQMCEVLKMIDHQRHCNSAPDTNLFAELVADIQPAKVDDGDSVTETINTMRIEREEQLFHTLSS